MTFRPAGELGALMPALLDALSHSGTGVLVFMDSGRPERWYANEAAAAMFGYSLAELEQLANAFRNGQAVPPTLELTGLHKDGSRLEIDLSISAHRDADKAFYVIVMRDVANHPAHLSLLEADRIGLVGALAAGFAHEINNPLTSVLLNLRSLRKHLTSGEHHPQTMRCLDDVTTGAERIASNVRALQTLATRNAAQRMDLAAVVSSALRLAAPTIEPRAHVIRQIFPVCAVTGEESRVGQAVLAMLLFSSSGFETDSTTSTNRIIVAVEERSGEVIVEVSDNGRDLTPEEARRAFDPFFRSPARGAGVGVGLGVARSVATTLGGEVSLAPRPGGGAVITMRLPAADVSSTA
jgi:two-component system NtrC family sensor kinase